MEQNETLDRFSAVNYALRITGTLTLLQDLIASEYVDKDLTLSATGAYGLTNLLGGLIDQMNELTYYLDTNFIASQSKQD